jgi:hypothetical protein
LLIALRLGLVEHHDHALRLPASVDLRGRPGSPEGASGVAAWASNGPVASGRRLAVEPPASSTSEQVNTLSHTTASSVTINRHQRQ